MSDEKFTKGLLAKRSNTAPEFVICGLSIKKSEFIEWLNQQDGEWVNIKINRSKKDNSKLYGELDTWKPTPKEQPEEVWQSNEIGGEQGEDLPF